MDKKNTSRFDSELLDKDILVNNLKEQVQSITWDYHNNLLTLMDYKRNGDGAGGKETTKLMYEVIDNFGSLVAKQSMMIEQSLEMAKVTLERAFVLSGLDLDKISEKDND